MMHCGKLLLRSAAQTSLVRELNGGLRVSSSVASSANQNRRSSFSSPSAAALSSIGEVPSSSVSSSASSLAKKAAVGISSCGFPKQLIGGPSTVLDGNVFGEDACFIASYKSTHVAGVADGVGGWRRYNIDSSKFSSTLMRLCSETVQEGSFEPSRPDLIIAKAFKDLTVSKPRPSGSSTACVLCVHQNTLYSANLGDSGFLIYRDGKVIHKSKEQTHYFNAPFQLTVLPDACELEGVIMDAPEKADVARFPLCSGDVILLATDGLWDNVPEGIIVETLSGLESPESLQGACNSLALIARRLSHDEEYASPFAVKAEKHGINTIGGKPDDIVIVLFFIE